MELSVEGVTFHYGSIKALEKVTFKVSSGEVLGVIGPNGSGKTTLLRCINRVLKPKFGVVLIDNKDMATLGRREIAKRVGVVPQESSISFPFTVLDIVLMGRTPYLRRLGGAAERDLMVVENAMRATNTLHLAERRIDEISGGEKQRVIIARALAQEPKILLLDEPTLHLDINHQLEILELIKRLVVDKMLIAVLVSHDLNLASRYCDKLLLLRSGKIFSAGPPKNVLTEENIRSVYGIDVEVGYNPRTGSYTVTPLSILGEGS